MPALFEKKRKFEIEISLHPFSRLAFSLSSSPFSFQTYPTDLKQLTRIHSDERRVESKLGGDSGSPLKS
jgi:hypothetical protein